MPPLRSNHLRRATKEHLSKDPLQRAREAGLRLRMDIAAALGAASKLHKDANFVRTAMFARIGLALKRFEREVGT